MSDQTFQQLWQKLIVYAPNIPVPLAQDFVNAAYSDALAMGGWAALRGDGDFFIPPPETTGTVTLTEGSAVMTGSGTSWTVSLEGQQLVVDGTGPYYTVLTVDTPTQITLDRVWGNESITNTPYTIQLIYVRPPSDFLYFLDVVDVQNNWKIRINDILQEDIDRFDAQRSYAGTTWIAAPAGLTPAGSTVEAGLRRYELWPRPTGPKTFAYRYIRRPALMSAATDRPIWPIRGDILRSGAIAELCNWPGTEQLPNPFFDVNLYQLHRSRFEREINKAQREDQEFTATDIRYNMYNLPWAPLDAKFLQTHDWIWF